MALLDETINRSELPVSENNFEALPAGTYLARITEAEIKPTKAGTGKYFKIRYDILGPTHQGRVVYGNLNIRNPNPQAEKIGRQQLNELMTAIGLTQLNDTDQLIGAPLHIKLKVRESEEYGPSNDVSGFKAAGSSIESAPASAPAASSPPWAKK
jgi:Protein of unknown function (DUF669)